jgi:hypothetical protein
MLNKYKGCLFVHLSMLRADEMWIYIIILGVIWVGLLRHDKFLKYQGPLI